MGKGNRTTVMNLIRPSPGPLMAPHFPKHMATQGWVGACLNNMVLLGRRKGSEQVLDRQPPVTATRSNQERPVRNSG